MCDLFSGLVTRFGQVYSLGADTVKHEDIAEHFKLKDKSDYFARWEIIPIEKGNYLAPVNMDNWVFKLDEKELPSWWELEFETKCWRYFKEWMQSEQGIIFKRSIALKTPEELVKIYTKGAKTL